VDISDVIPHRTFKCVSEWILFNANWAICQLYYGVYTLHFDEMKMISASLGHLIVIPSQSVFALTRVISGEATNTNLISLWLDPTRAWTHVSMRSRQPLHHRCGQRLFEFWNRSLQCISQNIDEKHWNRNKLHTRFWFNKQYILIMLYILSIVNY